MLRSSSANLKREGISQDLLGACWVVSHGLYANGSMCQCIYVGLFLRLLCKTSFEWTTWPDTMTVDVQPLSQQCFYSMVHQCVYLSEADFNPITHRPTVCDGCHSACVCVTFSLTTPPLVWRISCTHNTVITMASVYLNLLLPCCAALSTLCWRWSVNTVIIMKL